MAVTYASPFVLTTVEGNFGTAPILEQWRATWKIPVPSGAVPNGAAILTYLTAIKTAVQTFHTGAVSSGLPAQLVSLAGAVIGTDGKYLGGGAQETERYTYPSTVGGSGTPIHPFDAALCVSLRSTNARGRASRGRFYWPALAHPLGTTDGLVTPTNHTNLLTAAKVLIDAINTQANTILGPSAYVSVMSGLGSGTSAVVESVSIGRKLDHMSSRTAKQLEGHVWTDLTTTREIKRQAREDVHERIKEEAEERSTSS